MTQASPLVIIGSGLAGYTLAREFRKLNATSPLTIITSDDGSVYSKPMLSNALTKGKSAAQLATSSAKEMANKLNATLMPYTEVNGIEPQQKFVSTSKGEITFHRLVIACGAIPFRPPLAGDAGDAPLSINNLSDYALFRERLDDAQRIAIIGPGLIGCEFANDLIGANKAVTIIGPDLYPISGLLPKKIGHALKSALSAQGVAWYLETVATTINKNGSGYRITLANGTEITADLVVSAVGLRPHIALAKAAEIKVNHGIVTNQFLETSENGIYALGDCAEVCGENLPFIMPLMVAARALAKTLNGEKTAVEYPVMPVIVKTPACPLVVLPPPRDTQGEWRYEGDASNITARFIDTDGKLAGFSLAGDAVMEKQALVKEL